MYRFVDCMSKTELSDVQNLLIQNDLSFDDNVTQTIGIYDGETMVATGSLYSNVIKMIAVDTSHQGENLTAMILTHLIRILNEKGIQKYFLFTTQKSKAFFLNYNFSLVYENDFVVMLENKFDTIIERLTRLRASITYNRGTIASIVMNCNPVTLGHLYLIEKCASQNDNVIIFLVEENKSVFPYEIRLELLKKSTAHLKNVHILPSTPYIISTATFPTYFLKEMSERSVVYMNLDISIFNKYFIPIFSIDFRYVGSEPLDPTTNAYNETMKKILKEKLVVIERLRDKQNVVSASLIRKLAVEKKYDMIKMYTPTPTYKFLKSKKGKALFHHE
ncbi:MAG: adenylyltransferase/cytidyltransferase family protein [Acholeplasmataceae bacterium]|nr:adenylyltransferase/cytidyltransferase family protein [Acholeplasmataceae bacterium]